ncbi:hypothetical protein PFICI_03350 [Pestalotiopsis fici W106-1]|uniref:Heterokaryon incompatibility domain-containing protein n=1 Tax=Pestalotiopsis fici (strain W106-1 / CGMCC3.15140) TaxID=1229662 RepID=W3XH18_PESFW|nr:uncharacterized protein PFICI_03350 [Pestalotiopsis fici W106-1]ETS85325.1 hypothetical protein PFICI_03350 [Pestalotiopsis fici W106-1]
MLHKAWESEPITKVIRVERYESFIQINGQEQMLSIYGSPALKNEIDQSIQIGYPSLSAPNSDAYFEILRQWLTHCDKNHGCVCPKPKSSGSSTALHPLPTRVIEVGKTGDERARLHETSPNDKGDWIALSHQWGTGKRFRTMTENFESHINGISCASLPATFHDAVKVTRALGCPYLWIDLICIVQEGSRSDFHVEAKNMEQVFSGAYCVLASSRDPGHDAGFLQARTPKATLSLQKTGQTAPLYITEPIGDFHGNVLEGSLNQRGWVLQEHALARRTIYFTHHQTYFECGDGVRYETMTRLTSLTRIEFPPGQIVPSWSRMALGGGIDYIGPPFGRVVWNKLRSPWSSDLEGSADDLQTKDSSNDNSLVSEARDYGASIAGQGKGEIIFDIPGDAASLHTKCVVLGVSHGRFPELKPKLYSDL